MIRVENAKVFYVTKSLTTIWQFTSVWVLSPERHAKVAKSEANESFRQINELTAFLLLCLPSRNSSKHAKHFDFSCWSPDEIMRLFLHSCTSYLYARSSVVFWVNCFGYFSSFLKLSLSLPHGIVRYCFISFLLPWLDSIHDTQCSVLSRLVSCPPEAAAAIARSSSPLFRLLIIPICRSAFMLCFR